MVFYVHLPLTLTLIRLIIAPCSLPFLIVFLAPHNTWAGNIFLAIYFLFFGITDFFDGYLARKLQQVTMLGSLLDPLADKFLLFSALIALLAVEKISYWWVLIFIGREFFVMGLRQFALENRFTLSVSFSAKIKTVVQCVYITLALLNPYQGYGLYAAPYWNGTEMCLLALALFLSLFSAGYYCHRVRTAYTTYEGQ